MDRKLDLKKGQQVFVKIEEGSNAARRKRLSLDNIEDWVFEGTIVSVGRKYVTVKYKGGAEDKFEVENDYRQHYTYGGSDYKLYTNKQDIIDEKESEDLYREIERAFNNWNNNNKYTLHQLKRIKEIINET